MIPEKKVYSANTISDKVSSGKKPKPGIEVAPVPSKKEIEQPIKQEEWPAKKPQEPKTTPIEYPEPKPVKKPDIISQQPSAPKGGGNVDEIPEQKQLDIDLNNIYGSADIKNPIELKEQEDNYLEDLQQIPQKIGPEETKKRMELKKLLRKGLK